MIGRLLRSAALALAATVVLVAAVQLAPDRRGVAVGVWLLLLGALALRLLVGVVRLAHPPPGRSPFDAALDAVPAGPRPPAELERLARLLALSSASALHAQARLRPELRRLAADRLAWSRGIDLDRQPEQARAALGEAAWALLRPDPGGPADRHAPGPSRATLAAVLDAVEATGRH
jgi:hypothetical protein